MQILGKRSKILLIAVAIAMLVAIGVSFAAWDISAVKASNGDLSNYANAKVGDIIKFGRYYQTGIKDETTGEYEKTPIEWIVVDKDERTGQITLMSMYIIATGSYFGNYYFNNAGSPNHHYGLNLTAGVKHNQAYVDSTARAFLNNLERKDLGGDSYDSLSGYQPSTIIPTVETGLYTSLGFSNKRYSFGTPEYQRKITLEPYINRPAARGFYDEAFSNQEKTLIVPKTIAGYNGYRWPATANVPNQIISIESTVDKVWLPSATELSAEYESDTHVNSCDEKGSTAFEYFKNPTNYKNPYSEKNNTSVLEARIGKRTTFASGKEGNYSIPVFKKGTTEENTDIHETLNSKYDRYWTRSPMSTYYSDVRFVNGSTGQFSNVSTDCSYFSVRPFIVIQY